MYLYVNFNVESATSNVSPTSLVETENCLSLPKLVGETLDITDSTKFKTSLEISKSDQPKCCTRMTLDNRRNAAILGSLIKESACLTPTL